MAENTGRTWTLRLACLPTLESSRDLGCLSSEAADWCCPASCDHHLLQCEERSSRTNAVFPGMAMCVFFRVFLSCSSSCDAQEEWSADWFDREHPRFHLSIPCSGSAPPRPAIQELPVLGHPVRCRRVWEDGNGVERLWEGVERWGACEKASECCEDGV